MDTLVSALRRDELDHVMAVLNRDRGLRDRDNERLVRLRMELVREKRNGALVVGQNYSSDPNSRCARCLETLDLYDRWDKQKARCFLCKHLICKKCRVTKWRMEWEEENSNGKNIKEEERKASPIKPQAKSYADATTQTIISCDSDMIDASCPLCGSHKVDHSRQLRRRKATKDSKPKVSNSAKSKKNNVGEVSSSLPNLRTVKNTKPKRPPRDSAETLNDNSLLKSPVQREKRSNTFSGADNSSEKVPTYSFRDRRHSTSPKKDSVKSADRPEINKSGKVAETLVQLAELHPVISRRNKSPLIKGSSFTKGESTSKTSNPFEEGYEEPLSPGKGKHAKNANPLQQSTNSNIRRQSSDLRNPFINGNLDSTAKFKRISSADSMNPFLYEATTSNNEEKPSAKSSPVSSSDLFKKSPFSRTRTASLDAAGKANNTRSVVTSKPPASPNPAAHKFLMMAGVTPPRSIPSSEKPAPKKTFLTPNLSVSRRLDFTKNLTLKSNSLTRSASDRRRVSTESLLSSSFSDLKSSLKFPSLSLLSRKQQGDVQNASAIKEQTMEKEPEKVEKVSEETVPMVEETEERDLEIQSVVFEKMSDINSDNESERERESDTATLSSGDKSDEEDDTDLSDNDSLVEVTASSSSSCVESDVEYVYEKDVEEVTQDHHRLSVKSPIEDMIQHSEVRERKSAGRSLSESAVCALLTSALPLPTQKRLSQQFGSAEDLVGSDYSSEVGSHVTSDAMEADLDDSDASPMRINLYNKNARRLQHQRHVDEISEPPSRKSTRDSGYMTPEEMKRRRSPTHQGSKAWGPVERRAIRKQTSDTNSSLLADFEDGDRSDTESVKSDLSNASRLSLPTLQSIIFSSRQVPGFVPPEWICRVCFKTLEMQKKSGEWFRSAGKRDVRKKYERKPKRQSLTSATPPVVARARHKERVHNPSAARQTGSSTLTPTAKNTKPVARSVSASHVSHRTYKPRSQLFHAASPSVKNQVYQAVTTEATRKRWIPADMKAPTSEKIRAELAKIVPEPPPDTSQHGLSKFSKKKSSIPTSSTKPAEITDGPHDSTVVRGNPISLCCALSGTSPLKVIWRKGRDEIKHSSQCNIESTRTFSALTIAKSERDDSGCYTLQVTNQAGVDQFSVSVKVVDVPDPPGKPFAQSVTGDDIVVSWYGSGYDGGSSIKSYTLEMCKVRENGSGSKVWSRTASTNSTSHTVKNLEKNAAYMFRVCAENMYGVSKPGPTSDIVRNVQVKMENGADSSDEEEDESTFVKYEPVKIRQNQKFSTKYEIHEKLGQGRFGKVHRVTDRATGKHYAAKIMRALKVKDKEAVSLEIEIMNKLRHPKLVQLIDAFSSGREITMVMDLVAGGELFERVIDEDFILTEAACIKYMRQICAGVQFMHNSNIVHLDLKPENIMCINKTGTQIKLIDFGLARKFNAQETVRVMFGTPEFVAPEVINYDAIGFQTDLWSVGVICYILLSGLSPFSGDADSETLSNITAVKWDFDDEAFDQISDEAKDFISHLLVKSLKNRYTVDKALQHKWLKNDVKKMSKSQLNTKNLKRFLARRKWQKTGNAVRALGRLASLARLPTSSSGASNGQRESGFLSALKAQLVREKESGEEQEKRKPDFLRTFDDVEVVVGSAAKFECTISGCPDPEIVWYMDGKPIKESRHFRISYTEDDVCTLLITEAGPHDEAEFTCKAMNSEGTVEHSAELIVITPAKRTSSSSSSSSPSSSPLIFQSPLLTSSPTSERKTMLDDEDVLTECFKVDEPVFLTFQICTQSLEKSLSSVIKRDPTFQWFKSEEPEDENTLLNDEMHFKQVVPNKNCSIRSFPCCEDVDQVESSVLVLHSLSREDSGIYMCSYLGKDSKATKKYRIVIADEETIHRKTKCLPPRFVKISRNQTVPEGSDAVLKCIALGKPAPLIYWYMYGTRLYQGERHRFATEGTDGTLSVLATRWYDSGKYECQAVSPLGKATCTVDLCVQPAEHQAVEFDGAPMFLLRTESKIIQVGSNVTFKCTIAGTPSPKVYWKRGDHIISARESSRFVLTQNPGGAFSLTIKKVRLIDDGKYTCVAENTKGVALCGAFLMVELANGNHSFGSYDVLPLAPVFVTRPYSARVRCGYSAAFQCTVHGVPQPTLTWHVANGTKISSNGYYTVEDVKSHHTLRIPKTKETDRGFYFCTASNSAGEVSCSVKLAVTVRESTIPPSVNFGSEALCLNSSDLNADQLPVKASTKSSSSSKSVTLTSGKNAKISLTVRGVPKPEVTWYKEGKQLRTGNRFSLHNTGNVHQIRIARVHKDDAGLYSMLACNAGGLFTTVINISVREVRLPSVFTKDPEPVTTAHEGADAVIQCRLKEDLKPSDAKWWKENELLSGKTGKYEMTSDGALRQLTVKSVTSEDSGEYKCKVGAHTTSGKLSILKNQSESTYMQNKNETNEDKTAIKILSLPTPAHMEVPEKGTLILQHRISEDIENCKWTLNGKELKESERCKIKAKDGKYSLMLMNMTPGDAGDVVFTVPGTKIAITTSIQVQALPAIPNVPKIELKGDKDVLVSWQPTANDDDIDYVIEACGEKCEEWKEVGCVCEKVGHVTALGLEPGLSYRFRIKAHNKAGAGMSCQPTEPIIIPSKTYIVQGLDDVAILEGETARFNVQLSSNSCEGNWFLNGLKLSERGETCQLMTSGCAHSLVMRNLTKTGSATVQFVSRDGRLMTSAQLIVKGKSLSVVQKLVDETVTENADATFTVALSKAVNKLGKWYHKGLELTQSHDVIIEKRGEFQMLHMKNIKNTASGEIRFVMPGEPQTGCTAQLTVLGWFETEPFQKIAAPMPETTSVRPGEDAVFVVGLSSDGKCNSTWSHCDKPIPKKSKKYKIKQYGDEIRLTVRNVTIDDVGPIQCVVDKQKTVTNLILDSASIEVEDGRTEELTKPKFQFLDDDAEKSKNSVRSFSEGDCDVAITCRVSDPVVNVEWRKNGKVLDIYDGNVKVVDENEERKLIFKKMTPQDSATYECIIKYGDEEVAKKTFDVIVRETPQRITKQLSGKPQLTEGDTMRLSVRVEPPNADLVWLKDGMKLKLSNQKGSRVGEEGQETCERCLLVKVVTCQDSGVYSCETLHDSSTIEIKVLEPVVEVIEKLKDCECEDCGTVSFQVKLSRKPKKNCLWKLEGKKLTNTENCSITFNDNVYCATLRNLVAKDSGHLEFECGDLKESANLVVKPPPIKFTKRLSDVTVSAGFDAVILCEVNEEDSVVQWFRDGQEVDPSGRYTLIKEGRIRKLKVKDVTFEDSTSSFKCTTRNDTTTCTLLVQKPVLSVVEELEDVTVVEGERATFRCKLSLADVKVAWLKNGKMMKDEKHRCEVFSEGCVHELRLRKLATTDSGEVKLAVECDLLDCATLRVKKPPVQFTRDLRDQVVDLKVEVEMFCEVSDPEADVTWYRNDVTVEEAQRSTDMHIKTHSEGCKHTLIISRALMHHEARYSCVTEDGNRTSAELFVKVPPLTFVRPLSDVSKYVGDDVEFVVELSMSDVEGKWLLDSEPIKKGKKAEIVIAEERKALRLKDIQQSGIITYRVNKHVTSTCRLDVRERPVAIERRLSDVKAREGSDVTFECYFSKPDLQVTWYIDDDELESDAKFQIDSDGCTQRLRVRDVRYDDEANYSCRYKHRRTSAELTVLEPRIDVIKHLRDYDAFEGDSRMLECIVSLPVVSASWHKDGRSLMGAEAQIIKGDESVTHMLVLNNLSRSSSGSYSLVALNKTLTSCKVQVSPKPVSVTRHLSDVTVRDDEDELVLECEFSKCCPSVVWTCSGVEIEKSSDIEMVNCGQVQKLKIHSPHLTDSGRYACIVPKYCETSCVVKVEQWRIKFVQSLPQTLVFYEGKEGHLAVKFSEHVESDEVTWFVDDVMVDDVFTSQNNISVSFHHYGSSMVVENVHLHLKGAAVSVTCRNLAASCVIDVIGLPRPPQCIGGSQDGLHVKLTWKEPHDLGGCDVIDYIIEKRAIDTWEETECCITMPSGDKDCIEALVKGLTAGITYWFRVAAVSEHGIGEYGEFEDTFTPEEPLIFNSELRDLVVEEGETMEMWCELSRPSDIEAVWTVDDVIIDHKDERVSFYSYDDTREIVVEGAMLKDGGTYKCEIGNLTSTCHVTVKPQPITFVRYLDDVTAVEGNELAMSCELSVAEGKVKWYREGEQLRNSSKHQIIEDNSIHMLIVDECEKTDAGTYTCEIKDSNCEAFTTQAIVRVFPCAVPDEGAQGGVKTQQTIEDDVFVSDTFDSDSLGAEVSISASSEDSISNEMELDECRLGVIKSEEKCDSEDEEEEELVSEECLPDNTEKNAEVLESADETPPPDFSDEGLMTSSSVESNLLCISDDNVKKSVSFGHPELSEREEQTDDDKKWKRMSVASAFSDVYETANESFITDDDAFTDANEDTDTISDQRCNEDPMASSPVQNEEDSSNNSDVCSTVEDSDSACTVSSFNSVDMKVLSPVMEEDECEERESGHLEGKCQDGDDSIVHDNNGSTNLIMDLNQLREAFLLETTPTPLRQIVPSNQETPKLITEALLCQEENDLQKGENYPENSHFEQDSKKERLATSNSVCGSDNSKAKSDDGSQGLVDCLHHAYDANCVIKQLVPPVEETLTTTIVVDAKTGETVTMSSKKMEIVATPFLCDESRKSLEKIELPLDTTDDKLARMFGSSSSEEEVKDESVNHEEHHITDEVFAKDGDVLFSCSVQQVVSLETTHSVPGYDDIIESCVQALETIQETSAVALCSESEDEDSKKFITKGSQSFHTQGLSPGFKEGLHNQQVLIGSTVFLQCLVTARPAALIVWSKEGNTEDVMRLDESMPGISMTCVEKTDQLIECTLQLNDATLLDSGLYSCQASNAYGKSSCSAVIQVYEENDDINIKASNDDIQSGDVTPTGDHDDVYTSDDDVSISIPPPSENSFSFQKWKSEETRSMYSERAVQAVVDNADKMSMASASTKPIKIHVLESIVVRETYQSTDNCSDDESDSETSSRSPIHSRRHTPGGQYRQVAVKRTSRPNTACLSDTESENESFCSSVPPTPEVYYAVRGCGASELDSATLQLNTGQAVELMDVSNSKEWLVRTRPNKHNTVRMGFVDPAFLAPHQFTASPAPPKLVKESLPSATVTTEYTPRRESIGLDDDTFEFPNDVAQFSHVILSSELLTSKCSNASKRSLVPNLIKEEELYVTGLRKAIYVMKNAPDMPSPVESHVQELFGDLEGLEHFHTSTMLPALESIQQNPHLLPHVILQHHKTFEQLHLSYVMNTSDSMSLSRDDETIADGLLELSLQTGLPMGEIPQTTLQHLVLYQYYLKKLLHYDDTPHAHVRPIRDAVQLLTDIPNKARISKLWYRMREKPTQSDMFGKLIKEDVVGISLNHDEAKGNPRWRFRRIFLFENCLVVAKVRNVTSRSYSDVSDFEQIYQTDSMIMDLDESSLQSKVITLKSSETGFGEALWRLTLRTKTEAGKTAWIREFQRAIHMSMGPPLPALPRFTVPICDVTIHANEELVLYCYITNKPKPGVQWSKDDRVINSDAHRICTVERDNGYCALHVRHATSKDFGVYRCVTYCGGVSEITCFAQVDVRATE